MTPAQALVLAVGAVVLVLLLPRPARHRPLPTRLRRRSRLRRTRPRTTPDLAAVDRLLALSVSSAEDEHRRLRPLVLDIARQRLADHTGVRIDADPEAAARALGPDAWELIRPDRPPPGDRRARGMRPERLRALVESLERIGGTA